MDGVINKEAVYVGAFKNTAGTPYEISILHRLNFEWWAGLWRYKDEPEWYPGAWLHTGEPYHISMPIVVKEKLTPRTWFVVLHQNNPAGMSTLGSQMFNTKDQAEKFIGIAKNINHRPIKYEIVKVTEGLE